MKNSPSKTPTSERPAWLARMRGHMPDLLHTSLLVCGVILGAVLLVTVLTFWQSRIDETRAVDAIVVFVSSTDTDALQNRAIDLYRRRYARRLLVVNSDPETVQASLMERGVPEPAFLLVNADADNWRSIYRVVETARQHSIQSLLVVDNPGKLLLKLKVAQDLGVSAYGSRSRTLAVHPGTLLQTSLNYWQYILAGPGDSGAEL